jgi:hypothetical protein
VNDAVAAARERFERELDAVRRTLDEEWGWAPRGSRWIAPVVAVAAGYLFAGAVRRAARRLIDRTS